MLSKNFVAICFLFTLLFTRGDGYSQSPSAGKTIMDIKGFPTVFELNRGEEYRIVRTVGHSTVSRTIRLVKVTPYYSPDFWNLGEDGSGVRKFFSSAEIEIEIDGKPVKLMRRPYEHPIIAEGLRIYVEEIKEWAKGADLDNLTEMERDVRFSVCAAGETWGPENFVYPIGNYRFRSSSYNNTWGALVPYAPLYYHRGEDRGAIPDRLPVYSVISGKVTGSPLPDGDGASNGIIIQTNEGLVVRVSHLNIENIVPEVQAGSNIKGGDLLGYTGSTWLSGKNQTHDPHLHVEMRYINGSTTYKLSAYPYLMEAYQRKYTDPVLAIAGGYEFTVPGADVFLDGERSITRPGKKIKSYKWILHDGRIFDNSKVAIKFDTPGLFTEELIVETDSGDTDRDFLQVRVWDTTKLGPSARNISFGWIYQYPVRNVKAGEPVMFWNRIHNTVGPVYIDFGDGTKKTKMYGSIAHPYRRTGRYVATISATGPSNDPITQKLEVVVGEVE